jgi:hypothetical protein
LTRNLRENDKDIKYDFHYDENSTLGKTIPAYEDSIDGQKITTLLDILEEKTEYARRIKRKFPIEEYPSMQKCTECPCEPTFTIKGKIHFMTQKCLYSKTNIKMQEKLAENLWEKLKHEKAHCEKHTPQKPPSPIIRKENEFILQQSKYLSIKHKTCRLDRIKEDNQKIPTPPTYEEIRHSQKLNDQRVCPCSDIVTDEGDIIALDMICAWGKHSKKREQNKLDKRQQILQEMEHFTCRADKKMSDKGKIDPDDKFLRQCPCSDVISEDGTITAIDLNCQWKKEKKKKEQNDINKEQEKLLQIKDSICRHDMKSKQTEEKQRTTCPCTDEYNPSTGEWKYMGDVWCTWSDNYKHAMIQVQAKRTSRKSDINYIPTENM